MRIWRMRITCWISKATDTHSEYVILIAFPLQQWLHERASMLRYTYSACLVNYGSYLHSYGSILLHLIQTQKIKFDQIYSRSIATTFSIYILTFNLHFRLLVNKDIYKHCEIEFPISTSNNAFNLLAPELFFLNFSTPCI